MATTDELNAMFLAEQSAYVDLVGGLDEDQWATPSLCKNWTVRDVVVHIANHLHTSGTARVAQLVRAGLSPTRQLAPGRRRSNAELIEWLAAPATLGGPNTIRVQLAEATIHQQDVRRPLGIMRDIPPAQTVELLDWCMTSVGNFSVGAGSRRRSRGLAFHASDVDWSSGSGPEVRGPAEAIYMALNGRTTAVDDLEGDGVDVLRRR